MLHLWNSSLVRSLLLSFFMAEICRGNPSHFYIIFTTSPKSWMDPRAFYVHTYSSFFFLGNSLWSYISYATKKFYANEEEGLLTFLDSVKNFVCPCEMKWCEVKFFVALIYCLIWFKYLTKSTWITGLILHKNTL